MANNPPGDDMTTETEELPPLWALDKAANLAVWRSWEDAKAGAYASCQQSIIAHACTIAKYEPAPDPDKREREELARMFAAGGFIMTAEDYRCNRLNNDRQGTLNAYKAILKERGL